MQLSQSLLDQVRALANEAGKHLAHFYQQDVKIQTKSDNTQYRLMVLYECNQYGELICAINKLLRAIKGID